MTQVIDKCLTRWYPADSRPARAGTYETYYRNYAAFDCVMRYWTGAAWHLDEICGVACHNQNRYWRGLANDPDQPEVTLGLDGRLRIAR